MIQEEHIALTTLILYAMGFSREVGMMLWRKAIPFSVGYHSVFSEVSNWRHASFALAIKKPAFAHDYVCKCPHKMCSCKAPTHSHMRIHMHVDTNVLQFTQKLFFVDHFLLLVWFFWDL